MSTGTQNDQFLAQAARDSGGPAFPGVHLSHMEARESSVHPYGAHSVSHAVGVMEPHSGMTLRQFAAIKLRVPNSGTDWLDAMIVAAMRDDLASKAMSGILADPSVKLGNGREKYLAELSFFVADALIAERAK